MTKRLLNSFMAILGYILSPLSWWNDLVINVPLAYIFSIPFSFLSKNLFLPTFILGYWLTNLLGLILLHKGLSGAINPDKNNHSWRKDIAMSIAYTLIMVILVLIGVIKSPESILTK